LARSVLFVTALLLFPVTRAHAEPAVELSYSELFDRVCAQRTNYQIQPSWVEEAKQRLPEFAAEWRRSGVSLLRATEQIVGRDFTQKEFRVTLSVCSLPSIADPLLVNIRFSLKSFASANLSTDVTISTIFHEILHHYLSDKIRESSKLLAKYRAEDETVRSHLHLFGLQKAVYLTLRLSDTLRRVIAKDDALPNQSYRRTWEIVDDLENAQAFVAELRK
jgi:hypothetical protein